VYSDSGSAVEEETPIDYVVEKLYEQLQGQFHCCSEEEHEQAYTQHTNNAGDNHRRLSDVFDDAMFPSVPGLPDMTTPDRLHRQAQPTEAQWEAMFCSMSSCGERRTPSNACLHKEEVQGVAPEVAVDIDSLIGFASSPAFVFGGFWFQHIPKYGRT